MILCMLAWRHLFPSQLQADYPASISQFGLAAYKDMEGVRTCVRSIALIEERATIQMKHAIC